jgi:hypothetical protein
VGQRSSASIAEVPSTGSTSPSSPVPATGWSSSRGTSPDLEALERLLAGHGITNVIHLAAMQVPFVASGRRSALWSTSSAR